MRKLGAVIMFFIWYAYILSGIKCDIANQSKLKQLLFFIVALLLLSLSITLAIAHFLHT